MRQASWLVAGIIIGLLLYGVISLFISQDNSIRYPIVDKFEEGGKCYIHVEIKVTPDEYIGYDIGDEFYAD